LIAKHTEKAIVNQREECKSIDNLRHTLVKIGLDHGTLDAT